MSRFFARRRMNVKKSDNGKLPFIAAAFFRNKNNSFPPFRRKIEHFMNFT